MDLPLFNVLEKSGYLVYLGYFAVNSKKNLINQREENMTELFLDWTRDRLLKVKDLKKVMDEILPKKITRRDGIIEEIITELKSPDHDIEPAFAVKKEEELDIPSTPSNIEDEVLLIERTADETIIVEDDEEGDTDKQPNVADAAISPTSVPSKIFSSSNGGVRSMLLLPTDNLDKSRAQRGGVSPKRAVRVHLYI